MQVNRQDFLKVLKAVQPGIATNEQIAQSGSFIFRDGKIMAFNGNVLAFAPSGLPELTGAVHAKELLTLVSKLSTEQIDISFDGGQMVVKSGRARSGIRFDDTIYIDIANGIEEYDKIEQFKIPDGLLAALDTARFCAATNRAISTLTCLYVNDGAVMAMDGYRAISFDVPHAKNLPAFLLPADSVSELFNYKPVKIGVTDTWAFFSNEEGVVYSCRLHAMLEEGPWGAAPFPDVADYMDVEGTRFVLPKTILDVLDKAEVFTNSHKDAIQRYVTIAIKPGRVVVKGEGVHGWYEESIPDKNYEGAPLEFMASTNFLRQILPLVQDAMLAENGVFVKFIGENFTHVFACVHRGEEEKEEEGDKE